MSEPGLAERVRTHLQDGWEALGTRISAGRLDARTGLLGRAVSATRPRVLAEAILILILGFTADDLRLLLYPGWLLAGGLAFLHILLGGLWYGHRLEAELRDAHPDQVEDRLETVRTRGRLAAILAAAVLLAWLVFFTAGVPPWAL